MVRRTYWLIVFPWLVSCPEKVTGIAVPLDPSFYAAAEAQHGAPGEGGGSSKPFATYKGETINLKGVVSSSQGEVSVDIDFRVPDPSSPGGIKGHGKLLLDKPGEFSLPVPKNLGELEIQGFQDMEDDGPSGQDPFAQSTITVKDQDIDGVELKLVAGARGGPEHKTVPPPKEATGSEGAGPEHKVMPPPNTGEGHQGGPGPEHKVMPPPNSDAETQGAPPKVEHQQMSPEKTDPFGQLEGPRVRLSGRLICDGCGRIDLDIFQPGQDGPGGRKMMGKMKFEPGEYEIEVPKNFGRLLLEAFVDLDGNGPGPGDWMGSYANNPVVIGADDVANIDIELTIPSDGKMPMVEVKPEQ